MPKCEFSETQFSFCYTFEFIESYCPWSIIPYFPNTVIEGRPGHGFDVRLAGNLYFQFKIPEYITIRRVDNQDQYDTFHAPFYRSEINTNSQQHNLLNQIKNPQNEVLYIMPEFNDNATISRHYHCGEIVINSAGFAIENLPPYQSGHHCICYIAGGNWGKMFSEPEILKKTNLIDSLRTMIDREADLSLFEEAWRIRNILIEGDFKLPEIPSLKTLTRKRLIIKAIRGILLSYFNIIWTPIISPAQKTIHLSRI